MTRNVTLSARAWWWLRLFAINLALAAAVVLVLTGLGAAQATPTPTPDNVTQKAGYYNDSAGPSGVDNESWMDSRENATLANTTSYAVRFMGFVVGNGNAAGALVTMLLMMGLFLGMIGGTNVGPVASATLCVIALTGLVAIGFAPMWLYALVLMGLGVVSTVVIVRALQ